MMRWSLAWRVYLPVVIGFVVLLSVYDVGAQQCNDFNACTANDMCSDGMCSGTPASGGNCNDFNACTINDRCVAGPEGAFCMGDPAPVGTECEGGCGLCVDISPIPEFPIIQCQVKPGTVVGQLCQGTGEPNPCFEPRCQIFDQFTVCQPVFKECPDTDGNPCTDSCNFESGQCEQNAPRCFAPCEACNPTSGQCQPANPGQACDDFNVCTTESSCQTLAGRSFCLEGMPSAPTFTPTTTPTSQGPVATATPTSQGPLATATQTRTSTVPPTNTQPAGSPTVTPTRGPCVGDCDTDDVVETSDIRLGVTIALGEEPLTQCPEFNAEADARVVVTELVLGVRSHLFGCT